MNSDIRNADQNEPTMRGPHTAAARGLSQMFGIHPAIAFLTLIIDSMLFGGAVITAGAILPLSCACGVVLALITFLTQRKFYGDDNESALIKSLIVGFLTAVPSPLPLALSVPAGIVGLVHIVRRK